MSHPVTAPHDNPAAEALQAIINQFFFQDQLLEDFVTDFLVSSTAPWKPVHIYCDLKQASHDAFTKKMQNFLVPFLKKQSRVINITVTSRHFDPYPNLALNALIRYFGLQQNNELHKQLAQNLADLQLLDEHLSLVMVFKESLPSVNMSKIVHDVFQLHQKHPSIKFFVIGHRDFQSHILQTKHQWQSVPYPQNQAMIVSGFSQLLKDTLPDYHEIFNHRIQRKKNSFNKVVNSLFIANHTLTTSLKVDKPVKESDNAHANAPKQLHEIIPLRSLFLDDESA